MVIEAAVVVEVDPSSYTCVVITERSGRRLRVEVPSVRASNVNRSGIHFMPEVDDTCYVIHSGNVFAHIVGFGSDPISTDQGGDYKSSRPSLEPGAVAIASRNGKGLRLEANGVLSIGATSLSERLYIPTNGLIQDHFLRYNANTPLGSLVWEHSKTIDGAAVDSQDERHSVLYRHQVKALAQDAYATVDIAYGRLDEQVLDFDLDSSLWFSSERSTEKTINPEDVGVISVAVRSAEGASLYKMQVADTGDVFALFQDIQVEARGDAYLVLSSKGTIEFGAGTLILDASDASVRAVVERGVLQFLQSLLITTPQAQLAVGPTTVKVDSEGMQVKTSLSVDVGDRETTQRVLVDRGGVLADLISHTHVVVGAVPAAAGVVPIALPSQQLTALTRALSRKLRAD